MPSGGTRGTRGEAVESNILYYLVLSLGANVIFFGAVFLQHQHIERLCALNSALERQTAFWQARFRVES